MLKVAKASEIFEKRIHTAIIDVRSPAEHAQGHIPGSFNIPLFSDEERAKIGTIYKQIGTNEAFTEGMSIVQPRLKWYVEEAERISPEKRVIVHCWRGGKRSQSFGELLHQSSFDVVIIDGGYKAFRRFIKEKFVQPISLIVLSGPTGSGKTEFLKGLGERGYQILDLEAIALHKGSVFGDIGENPQPTTEQFENNLYFALQKLDLSKPIWVESESHSIGNIFIPFEFFHQMQNAKVVEVFVPFGERVEHIIRSYGLIGMEEMRSRITRIRKRMGFDQAQKALTAFENGDLKQTAEILLLYYDKAYKQSNQKLFNKPQILIEMSKVNRLEFIEKVQEIEGQF